MVDDFEEFDYELMNLEIQFEFLTIHLSCEYLLDELGFSFCNAPAAAAAQERFLRNSAILRGCVCGTLPPSPVAAAASV